MKKRSIAAKLGVAALALTLVTTSLSSGTFAKYTSTVMGNANVTIATWNMGATLQNVDGTTTVEMSAPVPATQLALSATAEGIKTDRVSANMLAPGMKGTFGVAINPKMDTNKAATDVAVRYDVYIQKQSTSILPTYFTMWNGKDVSKTPIDLSSTAAQGDGVFVAGGTLKPGSSTPYVQQIGWEWPYESGDASDDAVDTGEGKARGGQKAVFTVVVKLTQVDPNAELDASHPFVN